MKPKRQSSNLGPNDEGLCGVALYSYVAGNDGTRGGGGGVGVPQSL